MVSRFCRGNVAVRTKCYYSKGEYDAFVAKNHPLILSFLRSRRLDESEFYDVVVFGFLKAADAYLSKPELRTRFKFGTIAYVKMRDALSEYRRQQNRQKRKGYTVSLDAPFGDEDGLLTLHDVLSAPDSRMMDFETELLMLELASRLSKRDMRVLRMRAQGYKLWEIAKGQRMTVKYISDLLAGLRETVLAVWNKKE